MYGLLFLVLCCMSLCSASIKCNVTPSPHGESTAGPRKPAPKGHSRRPTFLAKCFEWAWQHPHSSRRLPHVARRSRKESSLQFHWRVVSNMLRVAPWNRLPLTARWLKQEYRMDFGPALQPPLHVPIAFGSVRAKKTLQPQTRAEEEEEETTDCFVCRRPVKVSEKVSCLHASCGMSSHLICLGRRFLQSEPSQLLPVEGECPSCRRSLLWGSLIRHQLGCLGDLEEVPEPSSQDHWADELQM
uniref:Structure-specific endonuclease subunit SLX1 C-terminal domain-containing protein n=1 Tax=Oryzias latipes TaxID=8090 RepID=A0A3P9M566_ORYLA